MKRGWLRLAADRRGGRRDRRQHRGVATARSARTAHKSTVKIGIIYSRTGLLSAYGAEYIEGLRLGLKYITNGTNKIGSHTIQLTVVDDKAIPPPRCRRRRI